MSTYSLQQQVFTIALISNAASGQSGSVPLLESTLKQAITTFFENPQAQQYVGTWSVAWGPVVTEPSGVTDAGNAMFVARGTSPAGTPVYVVTVAGTNPRSLYDVFTEDYDTTLQPWPYPVPAGADTPNVTQGTLDGLNFLLQMTDPATGTTLQSYLEGVQDSEATLVFTGHSLGGALSPAVGLALFGGAGAATLGTDQWGTVQIYPVAGPTVGDAAYSSLWARVFPQTQDALGETWNLLVWNTLDVVPHAWAQLSALSTLYPPISWTSCLAKILNGVQGHAAQAGGTFVQPQNQSLQGTFAPWTHTSILAPEVTYFLIEALHQHVWAYFDLLDVTEVRPLLMPGGDPVQQPVQADMEKLAVFLAGYFCR
jgi:hypothetical protein